MKDENPKKRQETKEMKLGRLGGGEAERREREKGGRSWGGGPQRVGGLGNGEEDSLKTSSFRSAISKGPTRDRAESSEEANQMSMLSSSAMFNLPNVPTLFCSKW